MKKTTTLPLEKWIVVDIAGNGWLVVSKHDTRDQAEAEADKRNEGLSRARYSACFGFEPIAERMGRPCG